MGAPRLLAVLAAVGQLALLFPIAGCSDPNSDWPPPPKNQEEQAVVDAARRAVQQLDGWTDVAFVVERHRGEWRVQAWKIVNPQARGRNRCVPWARRVIALDRNAAVISYQN